MGCVPSFFCARPSGLSSVRQHGKLDLLAIRPTKAGGAHVATLVAPLGFYFDPGRQRLNNYASYKQEPRLKER